MLRKNGAVLSRTAASSPWVVATSGRARRAGGLGRRVRDAAPRPPLPGVRPDARGGCGQQASRRTGGSSRCCTSTDVLLTGIHLMRTGRVEANLVVLNVCVPAAICAGFGGGQGSKAGRSGRRRWRRPTWRSTQDRPEYGRLAGRAVSRRMRPARCRRRRRPSRPCTTCSCGCGPGRIVDQGGRARRGGSYQTAGGRAMRDRRHFRSSRSRCGSSGRISRVTASSTAAGLPGRAKITLPWATPPTARLSIAPLPTWA